MGTKSRRKSIYYNKFIIKGEKQNGKNVSAQAAEEKANEIIKIINKYKKVLEDTQDKINNFRSTITLYYNCKGKRFSEYKTTVKKIEDKKQTNYYYQTVTIPNLETDSLEEITLLLEYAISEIDSLSKDSNLLKELSYTIETYTKKIEEGLITIPAFKSDIFKSLYNNLYYIRDENGNVSLIQANPELQEKKESLIKLCEEEGIPIRVTETTRTVERQDELYNQGRDRNGNVTDETKIVTNKQGNDYSSAHQWGIAFDVCINEEGNEYNEEKLKQVGEIGESLDLEWGGKWTTFQDTPHFQLKGYSDINKDLKNKYKSPDKFVDTW